MLVYNTKLLANRHNKTMGLHFNNTSLDCYRYRWDCKLAQSHDSWGQLQRRDNFHGADKVFPYLLGHHMGLIYDGIVHYFLVPSGTKRY